MNTRGLLDQLLKSGQEMLQNKAGGGSSKSAAGGLGGLLGGSPGSSGLGGLLSGAGGGALAAGAMGLLLGNKKVRKVGGKVAIYGGLLVLLPYLTEMQRRIADLSLSEFVRGFI